MFRAVAPFLLISSIALAQAPRPRLAVLVSVDQLASWVLDEARPVLPVKGSFFRGAAVLGLEFSDCALQHAATFTGPGHATLSTGGTPSQHGIVQNNWFDRKTGLPHYCCFDPGARGIGSPTAAPNIGPGQLQGVTLGDAMKAHFGAGSRVVSLSWKDRAAILMGGRSADVAVWADRTAGSWISSDRFMPKLPPWLEKINASRPFDAWHGRVWRRAGPAAAYAGLVDDRPFELATATGHRTLPRAVTGGLPKPGPLFYDELYATPFGNDALMNLVDAAMTAEKLGQDDVPDLLCIGFSANDSCGHRYGPRSIEVRDMTIRTDRMLTSLIALLDAHVGEGRWSMVITSDHGVRPSPESVFAAGVDAGRGNLALGAAMFANRALQQKLGVPPEGILRWVYGFDDTCLFLDYGALAKAKVTVADATKLALQGARVAPGVQQAFSVSAINKGAKGPEPWTSLVRSNLYPGRSGDIYVIHKPWWINTTNVTTHGSPHPQDREVPLWFIGAGPWKKGRIRGEASPALGAVMLAESLGVSRLPLASSRIPDAARR
ncbi:MAG: alkaline phosphatase family protein [Planctomycetes bacterium]|nr:alkaline phosphatase family protein [Planctomycetota bacterium]